MKEYKILLTRESLNALSKCEKENLQKVASFLTYLREGKWEEGGTNEFGRPIAWYREDSDRRLVSCQVTENAYAIWEPLITIDLLNYLDAKTRKTKWYLSPHVILHSFGEFSGELNVQLIVDKIFYPLGDVSSILATIEAQWDSDKVTYNEELYILGQVMIESLLKGEQHGLPLHMTAEQAKVLGSHLEEPSPVLLSGEAGSGKTTVITHWLLLNHIRSIKGGGEPVSQLFVTFSDLLVDRSREEFTKMCNPNWKRERKPKVEFLTYRQLLRKKILESFGGLESFEKSHEMTFERFLREYSIRIPQQLDPVLVWDEIRSVIKGGAEGEKPFISLKRYQELSERRGQCKTPTNLRGDFYKAAQTYQNYLDKEGLWDSIDLAFACLQRIRTDPGRITYDKIACDEVQDLAPVEIRLLIYLVSDRDINRIFFTGDMAQVINPSGFTWPKLKGTIGDISGRRHIRDAWLLKRNFRSTTEIVAIVNNVLDVREKLLEDQSGRSQQVSYKVSGMKPMLLNVLQPKKLLDALKDATSSPKERMILTKTKEQKEDLIKILSEAWSLREEAHLATVLTVEEAKGLEWDGVLLWNFFIPRHEVISKNDWEEVFIPAKRKSLRTLIMRGEKHPYGLGYEFNLLHVGLTRARNLLFIYDEDKHMKITNLSDNVADLLSEIDLEVFKSKWETKAPSAEELEEQALNLLEKDKIQAELLFKDAAIAYQKLRDLEKAAECYEQAGDHLSAAECHEQRDDRSAQERSLAMHFESMGDKKEAGDHWMEYARLRKEEGDKSRAVQGFEYAQSSFGSAELFTEAARAAEARASLVDRIIKQLEIRWNAVELWEKARKRTEAIKVLYDMIPLKDIQIKLEESQELIWGEYPEVFFAEAYKKLAELLSRESRFDTAISAAMEAAGKFKMAKDGASSGSKPIYRGKQVRCISIAVDCSIKAEKFDTAIELQRELIELSKEKLLKEELSKEEKEKAVGTIGDAWERLNEILQIMDDPQRLLKELEKVVDYVIPDRKKRKLRMAYDVQKLRMACNVLKISVDWLSKKEAYVRHKIKALNLLAECHQELAHYSKVGEIFEKIGDLRISLGKSIFAIEDFRRAGGEYLRAEEEEKAFGVFSRGKEVARSEQLPADVGWYCFKVALELVATNWRKRDPMEKKRFWVLAKEWTIEAADALVIDINRAEREFGGILQDFVTIRRKKDQLMTDFIEIIREKEIEAVKNVPLDYMDENSQRKLTNLAWSLFCLALVYENAILQGLRSPMYFFKGRKSAYAGCLDLFNHLRIYTITADLGWYCFKVSLDLRFWALAQEWTVEAAETLAKDLKQIERGFEDILKLATSWRKMDPEDKEQFWALAQEWTVEATETLAKNLKRTEREFEGILKEAAVALAKALKRTEREFEAIFEEFITIRRKKDQLMTDFIEIIREKEIEAVKNVPLDYMDENSQRKLTNLAWNLFCLALLYENAILKRHRSPMYFFKSREIAYTGCIDLFSHLKLYSMMEFIKAKRDENKETIKQQEKKQK